MCKCKEQCRSLDFHQDWDKTPQSWSQEGSEVNSKLVGSLRKCGRKPAEVSAEVAQWSQLLRVWAKATISNYKPMEEVITGSQPLDPDTGNTSGYSLPKSSAQPWGKQLPWGAHGEWIWKIPMWERGREGEGEPGKVLTPHDEQLKFWEPPKSLSPRGECGLLALLLFSAQPIVVRKRQCPRAMVIGKMCWPWAQAQGEPAKEPPRHLHRKLFIRWEVLGVWPRIPTSDSLCFTVG